MSALKRAVMKSSTQVSKRSVKVYSEDGDLLRTDTPDSTYKWLVKYGEKTFEVNADIALPCIKVDGEDMGDVVAQITKVGLPDGAVKYGPASVHQAQLDAWVTAMK